MKRYKCLISIVATLCLLASLMLPSYAADPGFLKINNQEIDKISIAGDNDGITIANNSYKITATDSSATSCGTTTYTGRARTLTFTNNYKGWIKITYTIDASGSLAAGTNCTVENGVITVQSGGTFTITVKSSDQSGASSSKSTTAEFKPTVIEYQELTPLIGFAAPAEHGTFTVAGTKKAEDGSAISGSVSVPGSAEYASYTLTAEPDSGYQVFRWIFTNSSGVVTYFGEKTNTLTYKASEEGTITCEFMRTGSAVYAVDNAEYVYLDKAIAAAGTSKKIVVKATGSVFGSTGQTEFTIPNGVTLVVPYAEGQTTVQGSDLSSNKYYPYGNYTQGTGYSAQPSSLSDKRYLELTIPSGTTVKNNGVISVGGTVQGNAAMNGAHSNLVVNGTLELKSSTSVLSAIGYVYGSGSVVANGGGAKIFQPFSLLRNASWGWSVANVGQSMSSKYGMKTYPADGYNGGNPSPRYSTQAIQCRLEMAHGDYMYAYADQACDGNHYMCTVVLIGTVEKNQKDSLIALHNNASLVSTYDSSKKSTLYGNVGKLTLDITGGATQGSIKLSLQGWTLDLTKWPYPVPYNYDVILRNGTYNLQFDMSVLPGAGLTVGENATFSIPSGVHLAVFTGANDHSMGGTHQSSSNYSSVTTSYKASPASPNYPANSTLSTASGGSNMANFVVDGGTLDVQSGAYFGGIVQTTGSGKVIMNGVTSMKDGKDYVFTRQLGLTGSVADTDLITQYWKMCGATIYKFYPQYFDANGVLQTMEADKVYGAANATSNAVPTYTFDLYTNADDVTAKETHTETINATATGQWHAHVYTSEVTKQPTCTENGVTTYTCSCGDSYTEDIQATGHNMKETQAAVAATCTADGKTAVMTCQNGCGHTEGGATIPALDHTWTAATCTAPMTCSVCGATEGEAKGHTWTNATCTAPKTCSVCGATEGEAKGHTWTDATCTAPKTCSVCGETEGEAKGHTPGATATCTTAQICTVCSAELVAAKGHSYNAVITAPTCSDKGYTTHTCTNCGDTYTDSETAAHGHTWTDATCTAPKTCSVCGATEGEALGHSYNAVITAPTVDAQGYTTHTCTRCGDSYVDSYVDKLIAAAEVNGTKYETLTAAIAAAQSGDTVTLLEDIELTKKVNVTKSVTIDLNGKTITANGCNAMYIYSKTEAIDVTVKNGSIVGDNIVLFVDNYVAAGTVLNVYDCDVKCTDCAEAIYIYDYATVNIYSGTFESAKPYEGNYFTLNIKDANRAHAKFNVYGGTFVNFNPYNNAAEGANTNFVAEGKHASADEDGVYTVHDCITETVVENEVAATCTNAGSYDKITCCTECGEELTRETVTVPATGHNYTESVTKQPTCTEKGEKTYTCSCGDTYTEEITALDHDMIDVEGKAATCNTTGYTKHKKCANCDYVEGKEEVPVKDHVWVDADCVTPKTCTACGATEGAALGHTVVVDEAVDPTCTVTGLTEGKHCSVCGKVLVPQNVVDAKGHTEVIDAEKAPTCTATGLTEGKHCSVCDEVLVAQNEVAALGHDMVTDAAVAPTCTATGLTEGSHCSRCNGATTAQETVAALGHDEVAHEAKAPTCTEIGWDAYVTCSRCGYTTYEEKAALGHTEVVDEAVYPTCTETGLTEGSHCDVCDEVLVAQEVVDALGHTVLVDEAVSPTCTETGLTEGKHCEICGEVLVAQEVVDAKGHTVVVDEAVDSTCTETGLTEGSHCDVCNETLVAQEVVDALGHNYTFEVTTEPTCTEKGEKTFTCTTCGDTYTEEIEATGHNAGAPVVENRIEATETDDGSYDNVIYCTVCGSELSRETITIPATGVQPEEPELDPVVDMSGSVTAATVTAPAGGWKIGDNTFTVSCDVACVVMRKDAYGEYHRLTATGSGDTYSFTADLESVDDQIIVAIKGDISGEGEVDMMDQMCMDYLTANPSHPMHMTLDDIIDAFGLNLDADALMLIADLCQDGELDMMDQLYMDYATANGSFYLALEWDI